MRKHFARNLLAATALGLLAAMTAANAQDADRRSASGRAFGSCDGGAQEAVFTNTQSAQANTSSPNFVEMPSTRLQGGGSGSGVDLYTVTLSGEAANTGGGNWEAQAQVSLNGGSTFLNIDPIGANTFHSGNPRETHTMTWCKEIGASSTIFRIVWRKLGGGFAFIDDYLMRVERSD